MIVGMSGENAFGTEARSWVWDPKFAPVLRFMQDQPLVYDSTLQMHYDGNFTNRVSDWVRQLGKITPKQVAAIEKIIGDRGWVEPPRFRPFATLERVRGQDVLQVMTCPGVCPTPAELARFDQELANSGRRVIAITIGQLMDSTRDVNDPRLPPLPSERKRGKVAAPYTTLLHQILAQARAAGTVIELVTA